MPSTQNASAILNVSSSFRADIIHLKVFLQRRKLKAKISNLPNKLRGAITRPNLDGRGL